MEPKVEKLDLHQVMLLNNDPTDGVEVHESTNVDFNRASENIAGGGSVFIMSRNWQKRLLRPSRNELSLGEKHPRPQSFLFSTHVKEQRL